jgi:lipopolysaccharide/colanic/teichoic acid biosynthesis glycosyltransferase
VRISLTDTETSTQPSPQAAPPSTIWGLTPTDLHDRFWASRGVQVVRPGEPSAIVPHAELYLLTSHGALTIFRPASLLDTISWLTPDLVAVRLVDPSKDEFSEVVHSSPDGRFERFERIYGGTGARTLRVGLTSDPEIVRVWQAAPDDTTAWQRLRGILKPSARYAARLTGRIFSADSPEDSALFLRELVRRWRRPDTTISGITSIGTDIWSAQGPETAVPAAASGPLWIGAGRSLPADQPAVGPAVLWDDPTKTPTPAPVEWLTLEPIAESLAAVQQAKVVSRPFKRAFDIAFALFVLLFTLPLYPIIAFAVWIEDGLPIFFSHQRETIGGRRFGCLKFRSMRRDAEKIKAQLASANKADGPQFFIPDDPRLTRVGRVLRDFQFDELPQFINVLKGDMSIVGPRPSPFKENQYCPAWREARLSVRPGVTGLWQIRRTRAEGTDFQEWIKYDIEYVENESILLDLWIIWKTVLLVLKRVMRS